MGESSRSTPASGPVGVGGWLLLFCLGLTVLGPLLSGFLLVTGYRDVAPLFDEYPKLRALTYLDGALSFALIGFSVYAGVQLWRRRAGAVKLAKEYLVLLLLYSLLASGLPFLADLPAESRGAMLSGALRDVGRTAFYVAIWYSYLTRSVRVRNTFPDVVAAQVQRTGAGATADLVRACPTCGAAYRLSDYRPDASQIYCSSCHGVLPRLP